MGSIIIMRVHVSIVTIDSIYNGLQIKNLKPNKRTRKTVVLHGSDNSYSFPLINYAFVRGLQTSLYTYLFTM